MNPKTRNLAGAFVVCAVVMGLGAIQCWFGRTEYAGDAISYLDLSKAVSRGDWDLAVSPYWSFGYPLLLAAARPMFAAGFAGEWTSIHILNLVLYAATYASFIYLLSVAAAFTARVSGAEKRSAGREPIFVIGSAIFVLYEIEYGCVSRIGPDQAVTVAYLLLTATMLQFYLLPRVTSALLMGWLMGWGYVAKAAFLPTSLGFGLIVLLHTLLRRSSERVPALLKLAWVVPAMALVTVPYVLLLSHATGFWTLGESGKMSYAWNVNRLPNVVHWQGGSPREGAPIHPNLVLQHPPVFAFPEPFHVTYPPWYEPFYWYEGYRIYFDLHLLIAQVKVNFAALLGYFVDGPHLVVKIVVWIICIGVAGVLFADTRTWLKRLASLWPLYLPAFATFAIYLTCLMGFRYVSGPIFVVLMTPFLALYFPTRLMGKWAGYGLVTFVIVWCALCLSTYQDQRETFRRAARCAPYDETDQWKVAFFLMNSGIPPGEKVASVQSYHVDIPACSWAYVSGVHVVAEIGNDGAYDSPSDGEQDFALFTGSAEVQQTVLDLFRKAGARWVILREVSRPFQNAGWQNIPGTTWFIRRL